MTGIAEKVPRAEVPANGFLNPRASEGEKPRPSSKCTYRTKTTRMAASLGQREPHGPSRLRARMVRAEPLGGYSNPALNGVQGSLGWVLNGCAACC